MFFEGLGNFPQSPFIYGLKFHKRYFFFFFTDMKRKRTLDGSCDNRIIKRKEKLNMFNSKKVFALCATTLAGFSAVSSLAPLTAFADVAKDGQTTVTYEGAPTPAEWGISVPSSLVLSDEVKQIGTVSIITEDDTKLVGHTFNLTAREPHSYSRAVSVNGPALWKDGQVQQSGNGDYIQYHFGVLGKDGTETELDTVSSGTSKYYGLSKEITFEEGDVGKDILKIKAGSLSHKDSDHYQGNISWTATEKDA